MKIIELNYKRDYPAFLKLVKARPVTKEAAEQAAAENYKKSNKRHLMPLGLEDIRISRASTQTLKENLEGR